MVRVASQPRRRSIRGSAENPICSSTYHNSQGNRRGRDSARGRLRWWTLSSKWNNEVIINSIGLNQYPFEIRYSTYRTAPLLCTVFWGGNILDLKTWSIRSIRCGKWSRNNTDPPVASIERSQTISLVEGWGHCL